MKRRLLIPAILVTVILIAGAQAFTHMTTSPAPQYLPTAAHLIITDHGCVLQPGDAVTVTVTPNTLIGFAYLHRVAYNNTYTASFAGTPMVRARYYLRFHGAKPWGLWVPRKQFISNELHIPCMGGKLGNMVQPKYANSPWPNNGWSWNPNRSEAP